MRDVQAADVLILNMERGKALVKEQRCETLHEGKGQFVYMNRYESDRFNDHRLFKEQANSLLMRSQSNTA